MFFENLRDYVRYACHIAGSGFWIVCWVSEAAVVFTRKYITAARFVVIELFHMVAISDFAAFRT